MFSFSTLCALVTFVILGGEGVIRFCASLGMGSLFLSLLQADLRRVSCGSSLEFQEMDFTLLGMVSPKSPHGCQDATGSEKYGVPSAFVVAITVPIGVVAVLA